MRRGRLNGASRLTATGSSPGVLVMASITDSDLIPNNKIGARGSGSDFERKKEPADMQLSLLLR